MATRALARRTPLVALLLAVLVAGLLGTWYFAGRAEVERRAYETRLLPQMSANSRGQDFAGELRDRLVAALARESDRDYAHYQNLFHDSRLPGKSVAPSPLVGGPDDPLVLGYFQIDADRHVTTPGINDQFPALCDTKHLAENRAFRDQVSRELAAALAPEHAKGPLVAQLDPAPPPRPHPRPHPPVAPPREHPQPEAATQNIQVDLNTYAQNTNANAVYWESNYGNVRNGSNGNVTNGNARNGSGANPTIANATPDNATANMTTHTTQNVTNETAPQIATDPHTPPRTNPPHPEAPTPVTVQVTAFEWRTLQFAGAPALIAIRHVYTPDANLTQGFVVDRATLSSLLASRAGTLVAELLATKRGDTTVPMYEIAPGWEVHVLANPADVTSARAAADDIARSFVVKFVGMSALAVFVALLVLVLFARAERLARERSQFAAAAAHELRTPLAGLQLYGDMLADGLGDPAKLRDYAKRMSEEASRLGRVVSNVLGFSQLERGNLAVAPKPDSVDAALRELAERAEPALDRAGAVLELDVATDLQAKFDRDGLARIVANLLDNAEKYSRGADDRTIRLAAAAVGDAVEIAVVDRGPGVSDRARLFRPFSRGVSNDGPAGLGLGLALSRSLARAMGGELAYRDGSDGAHFVVTLPRA